MPEQFHGAGLGSQQPEQHADRGGLARPVRPEKAVHAAAGHRHGQVVDGRDPAIDLAQADDPDGERRLGGVVEHEATLARPQLGVSEALW